MAVFRSIDLKPYLINKEEDGMFLSDCNGFVIEADELIEIGQNLIKFAKKNRKELEIHNIERQIEFEQELKGCGWHTTRAEKPPKKAYVYLLKCGGRYKIGFSDDVERRVAQLDRRPFPIKICCKSGLFDNACKEEQELHKKYEKHKICGEWYDFDNETAQEVYNYIKNLGVCNEVHD